MVIDLTHLTHDGMITFDAPWHAETQIQQLGKIAQHGRNTSVFILGSHTGTHIDAAAHFETNGATIDEISLDKLIGEVQILDFTSLPEHYCLEAADLVGMKLSERVLFCFGWSRHWNTELFYKDYPYFGKSAAQALIDGGVKVIGMDTPSPDDSRTMLNSAEDSAIHKLLLSNDVTLIEYLNNLDVALTAPNRFLCALPLLVKDADGAPARVCLLDK
jgi:arylformamidase